MGLSATLHLVAGLGALVMGGGVLLREPTRARSRQFAWLCAALALWNLGYCIHDQTGQEEPWRLLFLLGSSAAAPLGLYFSLVLSGVTGRARRAILFPAFALAGALWVAAWSPLYGRQDLWPLLAIATLGTILFAALLILGRYLISLPQGPERRALRWVLWGGVIAIAGGISDFIPRGDWQITELGPLALLLFLLIVCAVVVRQRFLDLHVFLIRSVALIAGAATASFVFFVVSRIDDRFITLFVTALLVLAASGPLGRLFLARATSLLSPTDPVAEALLGVSRRLPQAQNSEELWQAIEAARATLPAKVRFYVYAREENQDQYNLLLHSDVNADDQPSQVDAAAALPRLLADERLPITRRYLELEIREVEGELKHRLQQTLQELLLRDIQLVVPLLHSQKLRGWVAIGGALPEHQLTAELATAFLAVANQAAASFERIEAIERAKRQEALAAVGELAAGLAHELRNPVAAIRGAAQALGPQATPEQSREMLEALTEETARLERVVGEFLEYAKPGAPRLESVDLAKLAEQSLRSQQLAGRTINSELHTSDASVRALGDPDLLQRVFDNLIRNSWEAAGDGLQLRIEIYPVNNDRVAIRFEDNGPGIPPEQLPKLFTPFYTTKQEGTGLGLALAHRIAEAHQGELKIESPQAKGTHATLQLPIGVKS